jgi:hypothetical protein
VSLLRVQVDLGHVHGKVRNALEIAQITFRHRRTTGLRTELSVDHLPMVQCDLHQLGLLELLLLRILALLFLLLLETHLTLELLRSKLVLLLLL